MATLYGSEVTALDANPRDLVDPTRWNGKVHVYCFTWTADAAQNDIVEVLRLPPGIRIIHGRVDFSAMGALVTLDIGTLATSNYWKSALDVSGAGNADFANTLALKGMGVELLTAQPTSVYLKLAGANPASGTIAGYVLVSAI